MYIRSNNSEFAVSVVVLENKYFAKRFIFSQLCLVDTFNYFYSFYLTYSFNCDTECQYPQHTLCLRITVYAHYSYGCERYVISRNVHFCPIAVIASCFNVVWYYVLDLNCSAFRLHYFVCRACFPYKYFKLMVLHRFQEKLNAD